MLGPRGKRRMKRSLLPRRLLFACAAMLLSGGSALAQAPGGAVPVTTDPVQVGPVPIEIIANGIVTSESVVTVRTRVDGQITQVHVREGQMVRRGQPLFTLDSRLNQALLAQQEAQLARDRALLARAEADRARYQSLRGESFASQQRYEQAQADALAAAATVKADEAMIAQTRLNIEFATITAEIDGRLGALPLRVGNFVRQAENTAITTITQMDPILVQFAVPERWLPEIRAAMQQGTPKVRAMADQETAPPAEGKLVFVDSAVDTTTGTILLKARFDNADFRLWPGQYVHVTLVPREEENAITVAAPAVQTGQHGRFVFVLGPDGATHRRSVELVRMAGARAVVRGELAAGEKVIVDGAQRVT
ncbi:MAG: efflux RND transporter periplasmic adaptor subunit, partial [Acetobacteraceae bacterium]|nr:efflux RND transporter periplasmic adaptor subunit [Acetobacteraceae bacterium]